MARDDDFFPDEEQDTGVTPAVSGSERPSRSRSSSSRSSRGSKSSRSSSRGGSSRGGSSRGSRPPGKGGAAVLQQPGVRIALGAVFLVVLILVITLVVQDCRRNQLVDSYRSYVNGATQISADSSKQGDQLQTILANRNGERPADLQARVNQLAAQAQRLVDRAEALDPPGSLDAPNQSLVTALQYRVIGLRAVADAIPTVVQSRNQTNASAILAEAMQRFLASDVIFEDSFAGPAKQALADDDVTGIQVPEREYFLGGSRANQASPSGARQLIPALQRTGGTTTTDGTTTGGVRGTALDSVEAVPEGVTLEAGSTTTIQASEQLQWKVTVSNGGDFQVNGVIVRATFASAASPNGAQTVEKEIPTIAPGENATVNLPGPKSPTFGEESTLKVQVVPVAGETRVDNNQAEYPVKIVF
ncbi:MAG: DUF11 domain-containing protein [Thermoleophilia bacterium]|jgi:hypothetical protein|nr:DUF11 domain-containing protein [Thermoleophilia bacterium]